jgi:hypothetical protein
MHHAFCMSALVGGRRDAGWGDGLRGRDDGCRSLDGMLRRAASAEDEDGRRRDARGGKREGAGQRNPGHAPAPSALGSRLSRGSRSRPRGSNPRGAHPRGARPRGAHPRSADSRSADSRSAQRRRRSLRGRRHRGSVAEPKRRRKGSLSAIEADLRRTTGQAFLEVGLKGAPVGVSAPVQASGVDLAASQRAQQAEVAFIAAVAAGG